MKKSHPWLLSLLILMPLSVCWAGGPKRTSTAEGESLVYANGRSELVINQTLLGAGLGTILGDAIDRKTQDCDYGHEDCDRHDASRAAAGFLLGAGAGLGASLLLTRDGYIDIGRTMVINHAGSWGISNGVLLAAATEIDHTSDWEILAFSTGLGATLGTAVLTMDKTFPSGDVGLVKSGTMWGALLPLGIYLSLADHPDIQPAAWTALAGGNLGLLTMAFVAPKLEWSRKKSIWLDFGGLLGGAAGVGLGALLSPDNGRGLAFGGVAGSLAGILAVTLLDQAGGPAPSKPDEAVISGLFWKNGKESGLGLPLPRLNARKTGEKAILEARIPMVNLEW